MARNWIADFFGGGILARGKVTRQWKFIIFIFLLILLYITMRFGMRNTKQRINHNDEIIRELRSEYISKYTRLLHSGTRSEIEKLLEEQGLELIPPKDPPVRIKMQEN